MRKIVKFCPIVLLCVILTGMAAFAQQQISGAQSGTLGPGEYSVTGNITVAAGSSLEIKPGTKFINNAGILWNISGTFKAIGTKDDSICFTAKDKTPKNGWKGLMFLKSASIALFEYSILEYTHQIFSYDNVAGLTVHGGAGLKMSHSRVSNCHSDNVTSAISCKDAEVYIENCRIVHNLVEAHPDGVGILLENCKDAKILKNIIAYNDGNGQ